MALPTEKTPRAKYRWQLPILAGAWLLLLAWSNPSLADGVKQMWSGSERRHLQREFIDLWTASDNAQGFYLFGQVTGVGQVASKTDYGSRYQGSINWELPGAVRLFRDGRHGGGMLSWNALGTFISSSSQDEFLYQRIGTDSETYDDLVNGEFMIRELWYAHAVAPDVYLLGGKVNPDNIWDMNAFANEASEDFLAGSLNDSQAIRFPDSGTGINLQAGLAKKLSFTAGVQQNNADENGFNIDDLDLQKLFYAGELHWKPGTGNHAGNYRLLASYSRQNSKRDQGLSLSADQRFGSFGLFARLSAANNDINPVSRFVSGGFALYPSRARPRNRLGLGFSWSKIDSKRNETVTELFYRFEINRFVALTPDIQLISNPADATKSDNIWLANLRIQASF